MKKTIVGACALLLVPGLSFADSGGFFLEPMVTYEKGEGDLNFPAPFSNDETDLNGFGAGLRLGFHILDSLFIGADGRYSMPKFEDKTLNQDTDAKAWNYGPVLGLQMPTALGIRLWGGYIYDAVVDPDASQGVDERFEDGHGWRVGAGIKLGPTSLNAEYQDLTYDTTEIEQAGVFTPGTTFNNVNLDNKTWIFSVSFPMTM